MKSIFSIIIPTYNVEEKIGNSLESILKQDKDLYECIIVDGASPDGTIRIIKEYKHKFPEKIKYICEPDEGIYDAMNKGIDVAQGEYLYFLGAGDILKPDILNQVRKHLNFESEIIYGEMFLQNKGYSVRGQFDKYKICYETLPHQATFYHKSVFKLLGKYSLNYHIAGDYEFNLRCFGNDNIPKKYIDLVVANFEGDGIGDQVLDDKFENDKEELILNTLGQKYYKKYKLYNSYRASNWWINEEFINNINNNKTMNLAIFGSGDFGQNIFGFIEENNKRFNKGITVRYFFDNDASKWNKKLDGKDILKPDLNLLEKVDKVIIASLPGRKAIIKQLLNLGVRLNKLIILS